MCTAQCPLSSQPLTNVPVACLPKLIGETKAQKLSAEAERNWEPKKTQAHIA